MPDAPLTLDQKRIITGSLATLTGTNPASVRLIVSQLYQYASELGSHQIGLARSLFNQFADHPMAQPLNMVQLCALLDAARKEFIDRYLFQLTQEPATDAPKEI